MCVDVLNSLQVKGYIRANYKIGGAALSVGEPAVPVDDGVYHVVKLIRAGGNATLQVRNAEGVIHATSLSPMSSPSNSRRWTTTR